MFPEELLFIHIDQVGRGRKGYNSVGGLENQGGLY